MSIDHVERRIFEPRKDEVAELYVELERSLDQVPFSDSALFAFSDVDYVNRGRYGFALTVTKIHEGSLNVDDWEKNARAQGHINRALERAKIKRRKMDFAYTDVWDLFLIADAQLVEAEMRAAHRGLRLGPDQDYSAIVMLIGGSAEGRNVHIGPAAVAAYEHMWHKSMELKTRFLKKQR